LSAHLILGLIAPCLGLFIRPLHELKRAFVHRVVLQLLIAIKFYIDPTPAEADAGFGSALRNITGLELKDIVAMVKVSAQYRKENSHLQMAISKISPLYCIRDYCIHYLNLFRS
jgi:hypothetical protein